jgi:small subunit ribosomal protein S21
MDQQYSYKQYENPNRRSKGGETKAIENHTPVIAKHLEVKVIDNFDKAFKIFRSIVQKERIVSTFKEKQSYEKPSVKKRRKRAESQRKLRETEFKTDRADRDDKPRTKVLPELKQDTSYLADRSGEAK